MSKPSPTAQNAVVAARAEPRRPEGFSHAVSEVGRSFALTVERHASKPLWRLHQVVTIDGKTTEKHTDWKTSPDFWPELLPAHGRMRDFLFGEVGHNPPQQVRGG